YQWSIWAMTEAEEPIITALLHRTFFPPEQRDAAKADDAAARARKPLAVLDGALDGREHLLGPTFTVADLNVASVVSWAPLAKIDLSATPRVADWLRRCTSRPALQRVPTR